MGIIVRPRQSSDVQERLLAERDLDGGNNPEHDFQGAPRHIQQVGGG